jgi:hypothetical protein
MGRALIRLLSVHVLTGDNRQGLLDAVPEHCRGTVAALAQACAETWQEIAAWFDPVDADPAPTSRPMF